MKRLLNVTFQLFMFNTSYIHAESSANDGAFSYINPTDKCRLDRPGTNAIANCPECGPNITRQDYDEEDTCLRKICDIYGPANLPNLESNCVFMGKIIKEYKR